MKMILFLLVSAAYFKVSIKYKALNKYSPLLAIVFLIALYLTVRH